MGAFGPDDVMSDYDRFRSQIEIIMFIIFGVAYPRRETGVYNSEDLYGSREDHKEGKLCSLITYLVRFFSYKKKEGSDNTRDKVMKAVDNLAKLTGSLLGYDRGAFVKPKSDIEVMASIEEVSS